MEQLLDQILSNTLYSTIAVALLAMLVFAIIKKLIKLIFFVLVLFAAYLAYVHYTGGNVQQIIDKTIIQGTETAKEVKKSVEENTQVQEAKKKIENKLKK